VRVKVPHAGVVGLDLALKRSAACYVPAGWEVGDWASLRFCVVGAAVAERDPLLVAQRLDLIASAIRDFVADLPARPHAFVEDYGFSAQHSGMWIAEGAGCVKRDLYRHLRVTLVPVNQSSARKTLLQKVPQGKGAAPAAVVSRLRAAGFPHEGSDEADAFVVANHGRSLLGMVAAVLPDAR
jgi:hypothetical protein